MNRYKNWPKELELPLKGVFSIESIGGFAGRGNGMHKSLDLEKLNQDERNVAQGLLGKFLKLDLTGCIKGMDVFGHQLQVGDAVFHTDPYMVGQVKIDEAEDTFRIFDAGNTPCPEEIMHLYAFATNPSAYTHMVLSVDNAPQID